MLVIELTTTAGLFNAPCDRGVLFDEFQPDRVLMIDAVTAVPVGLAVPVTITSFLVLRSVSTTALTTVAVLRIDVARVVRVAIGTTHSIVPVCWMTRSLISAEPPSIDNLEQL